MQKLRSAQENQDQDGDLGAELRERDPGPGEIREVGKSGKEDARKRPDEERLHGIC